MLGLGVQSNNCSPEALRVGGSASQASRGAGSSARPCVARESLRSVALGLSAVELVAVRLLLVLILFYQRTLSGFTHSQFETVCSSVAAIEGHLFFIAIEGPSFYNLFQ